MSSTVPEIPPATLRQWEEEAAKLPFTQLDKVRDAAGKWLSTISTLTGLASLLLVFQGRNDVSKLGNPQEIIVIILLFVAFALAFRSILLAAFAAQGTPIAIMNDPKTVHDNVKNATQEARDKLKASRELSVWAVVILAAAIGFTWFSQINPPDSPTNALILRKSGKVICGELQRTETGQVEVKPPSGDTPISVEDATSLQILDSCPAVAR